MDTSIILAQFWGWMLIILSGLFLLRNDKLLGEILIAIENRGFMFAAGFFSLILGLVTVLLHNVWVLDWEVVVTLMGWTSLVKGITNIGFPEFTLRTIPSFTNNKTVVQSALVVALLLGAWLVWITYPMY